MRTIYDDKMELKLCSLEREKEFYKERIAQVEGTPRTYYQ